MDAERKRQTVEDLLTVIKQRFGEVDLEISCISAALISPCPSTCWMKWAGSVFEHQLMVTLPESALSLTMGPPPLIVPSM